MLLCFCNLLEQPYCFSQEHEHNLVLGQGCHSDNDDFLDGPHFELMPKSVWFWDLKDGLWVSGSLQFPWGTVVGFTTPVSPGSRVTLAWFCWGPQVVLVFKIGFGIFPPRPLCLSRTSAVIIHFLQTDCLLSWTGSVNGLLQLNRSTFRGGYFSEHPLVCAIVLRDPFISPHWRADCCCVIVKYVLHDLWQTECVSSGYTFNHSLSWLLLSKFSFLMCLLWWLVGNAWSWISEINSQPRPNTSPSFSHESDIALSVWFLPKLLQWVPEGVLVVVFTFVLGIFCTPPSFYCDKICII